MIDMVSKSASKKIVAGQSKTSRGMGDQPEGKPAPPLYMQIAQLLRDEIVSGIYPVGSLLPTEDSLCDRFSVSRYTIREALRKLREDGLVNSRQGAGTIVVPPRSTGSDIHQVMSINDLVAFATDTRLEIESIRTVTIDRKLSTRTGLPTGGEWLEICGCRQAEGVDEPVCWAEYYINREFAAVARLLQRHNGPIFPLIEDMFGQKIVEVNQCIAATLISDTLAEVLSADPGSAALEVRRTYKTGDSKTVQVTINTYPASRFQHLMTMRRVNS